MVASGVAINESWCCHLHLSFNFMKIKFYFLDPMVQIFDDLGIKSSQPSSQEATAEDAMNTLENPAANFEDANGAITDDEQVQSDRDANIEDNHDLEAGNEQQRSGQRQSRKEVVKVTFMVTIKVFLDSLEAQISQ